MNKEEVEIKKVETQIKEIEQRIREKKLYNPFLKFLFTGIIAGVVFFASWLGIYKELLFKKNTIAVEDARLAHLKNQQLEIENEMKIKAIEEQRTNLENDMNNFKAKNLSYIEQIKKLKGELDKSSSEYKEYEQAIKKAETTNKEMDNQLRQLKFSGSVWYLVADGYPNDITLLANGRIDGFGKFNDYWEIKNAELILYTGADNGKVSWTRKWIGSKILPDKVSGVVFDNKGKKLQDWSMTKKGGFTN